MTAREQQQKAADYLYRYKIAKGEVKDIERRIERRIDGLLHDWQDAQNRALDVMREVSDTINSISNAQARRVLMLYYVDGKKYPEIQKIIPCGNNACFKWRRIGLMEVYSKVGSLG